jgi:hypothetical protein
MAERGVVRQDGAEHLQSLPLVDRVVEADDQIMGEPDEDGPSELRAGESRGSS